MRCASCWSCGDHRREKPDGQRTQQTGGEERASAARGDPPAAPAASADHRPGHRLCGDRRGHHRAAAQHGGSRAKGAANADAITASWRRCSLHVAHRLRHPDHADQPDPPLPRHRLRAADPPGRASAYRPIMLLTARSGPPALARVIDTSLRYTVDKTTREILFLPLPGTSSSRPSRSSTSRWTASPRASAR